MIRLHKRIRRVVSIQGRDYVVSLVPANDIERFEHVEFRQLRKRNGVIRIPLESIFLQAQLRIAEQNRVAKALARKARRAA